MMKYIPWDKEAMEAAKNFWGRETLQVLVFQHQVAKQQRKGQHSMLLTNCI